MGLAGQKPMTCALLLALTGLSMAVIRIERVTRAVKGGEVRLRLIFNCAPSDRYRVIWTGRNGQIAEYGRPAAEQTEETRRTTIQVSPRVGPVTLTLGTGMEWLSVTMDTSLSNLEQERIHIPLLRLSTTSVQYPTSFFQRVVYFSVDHPELPDQGSIVKRPFETGPVVFTARDVYNGKLYSHTMTGTGNINWLSTVLQGDGAHHSDFALSKHSRGRMQEGVMTWQAFSQSASSGHLVMALEIGKSITFRPGNKAAPFAQDEYFLDEPSVDCSECPQCCKVGCYGVSGSGRFSVVLFKVIGGDAVSLVRAGNVGQEPVARVQFTYYLPEEAAEVTFGCHLVDKDGNVVATEKVVVS